MGIHITPHHTTILIKLGDELIIELAKRSILIVIHTRLHRTEYS